VEFIDKNLSKSDTVRLQVKYGDYVKLVVDIEKEWIVVGCELHSNGEKLLLEKGSKQENVWGGGVSFVDKQVDTTAVLNVRPRLGNNNLEILDKKKREKTHEVVREHFAQLWQ
jgi:hypothetical protein